MKKHVLAAVATGLLVMGLGGGASGYTIDAGYTTAVQIGDNPSTTSILEALKNSNIEFDFSKELYKSDPENPEEGPFELYYSTVFSNTPSEPSDAEIKWDGPSFITDAEFLLVKDGKAIPAWYLFDISNWNGVETLYLQNFWAGEGQDGSGSISHISIYGTSTPTPEPATILLFGAGLAGLAGVARSRKKANP